MTFSSNPRSSAEPLPVSAQLATKPISLIAFARLAGKNMLEVIPEATRHQTYLRGPLNIHYICDPEMITELLIGKGRKFPKAQFTKDIIGSAVGNGLILSEGEKWKQQRRRYSPLFAARNLPMLSTHFALTGNELANDLAVAGGQTDIARVVKEATLEDISRVMFSGSKTVNPHQIREGLDRYFEYIADISLFDLMGLPKWIPRLNWLKSKSPVTNMRSLARNVIETRQGEQRGEPQDFLDLMIAALDEDSEEIDTTVDNLLTFVVAGHETAANALAWGFYLLALYPDVQTIIRQEILNACTDDLITFESLEQMPRLEAHVKETLRLYPSAAFFARDADEDITVKGVHFSRGDAIFYPVYSLHRNSQLWDEPDAYQSERFLNMEPSRGQYIPYGDGPRICIGAQYAQTEIMVLMASVIRKTELGLSDEEIPRPVLTFTMRPGGPLVLSTRPVV